MGETQALGRTPRSRGVPRHGDLAATDQGSEEQGGAVDRNLKEWPEGGSLSNGVVCATN